MTKEQLKELGLTDEQVESVWADYGQNYVPKAQFNAKNDELKSLKSEVGVLKKANKDNEDFVKQIEALQKTAKETEQQYQAKIEQMKLDTAIDSAVRAVKGRNVKAIRAMLNMDSVKLEDGKLIGIDEQLTALKGSDEYLFESDKPSVKGVIPGEEKSGGAPNGLTKEDFNKMSYQEKAQLFNDDADLYRELAD